MRTHFWLTAALFEKVRASKVCFSSTNVLVFKSSFKLAFWQCDILSATWYLTLISIELVRLSNHRGIFHNLMGKTLGKRKKNNSLIVSVFNNDKNASIKICQQCGIATESVKAH